MAWHEGDEIDTNGPPAFGVDGEAPEHVGQIFCAGVGNLDLRLIGQPVLKNYGNRDYDGGTKLLAESEELAGGLGSEDPERGGLKEKEGQLQLLVLIEVC